MHRGIVQVRVEFEPAPIRHVSVQCPECEKWFLGEDICSNELIYSFDLNNIEGDCPVCGCFFNGDTEIEEPGGAAEVYKDVVKKKVVWE